MIIWLYDVMLWLYIWWCDDMMCIVTLMMYIVILSFLIWFTWWWSLYYMMHLLMLIIMIASAMIWSIITSITIAGWSIASMRRWYRTPCWGHLSTATIVTVPTSIVEVAIFLSHRCPPTSRRRWMGVVTILRDKDRASPSPPLNHPCQVCSSSSSSMMMMMMMMVSLKHRLIVNR